MFGRNSSIMKMALIGTVLALCCVAPAAASADVNVTSAPTITGTAQVGAQADRRRRRVDGSLGHDHGPRLAALLQQQQHLDLHVDRQLELHDLHAHGVRQEQVDPGRDVRLQGRRLGLGDLERDRRGRCGADADAHPDADPDADADARRRRRRPPRRRRPTPTPTPAKTPTRRRRRRRQPVTTPTPDPSRYPPPAPEVTPVPLPPPSTVEVKGAKSAKTKAGQAADDPPVPDDPDLAAA